MPNPGGSGLGHMDKLMHFAAFFSLALSGAFAWPPRPEPLLAAACCAAGLWRADRDFTDLDTGPAMPVGPTCWADAIGIACGLALARLLRRWGLLRQPA